MEAFLPGSNSFRRCFSCLFFGRCGEASSAFWRCGGRGFGGAVIEDAEEVAAALQGIMDCQP